MSYQPYTVHLTNADSPVTFTKDQSICRLSIIGKTAIVSQVLADNAITGLPAPSAIQLVQGQVMNFEGANGGPVENIVLTIPAGAEVDVLINRY